MKPKAVLFPGEPQLWSRLPPLPQASDRWSVVAVDRVEDVAGTEADLVIVRNPGIDNPAARLPIPFLVATQSVPPSLESVCDALRQGLAHLDPAGRILWCNPALAEFLQRPRRELLGQMFFDLAPGVPRRHAGQGLPGAERWLAIESQIGAHVYRIQAGPVGDGTVVLITQDVTAERRQRDDARQASEAGEARIAELESEIRLVDGLESPEAPRPTPKRIAPRVHHLPVFHDEIAAYAAVLRLRVEESTHRVDHQISVRLAELAERLGAADAGPRDVIELHGEALREATFDQSLAIARATHDAARLLVLELMGHLVSYYWRHRAGAAPVPPTPPPAYPPEPPS